MMIKLLLIASAAIECLCYSWRETSSVKRFSNLLCPGTREGSGATFPDIDYARMGYDILKGFPLTPGHDPGLTQPIFAADYSDSLQSTDCLWRIPSGYLVLPDVSCTKSFSSEVIKTSQEYQSALSKSASVGFGVKGILVGDVSGSWGSLFSASESYTQSLSRLVSGESVLILSRANCDYYHVKLLDDDAPPFSKPFLDWMTKLNKTDDGNVYLEFFRKFGTHFFKEMTFGASLIRQVEMKTSEYFSESKDTSSFYNTVSLSAAFSFGLFSFGATSSQNSMEMERVYRFVSKFKTTTITIGVPVPEGGDVMKWMSAVKERPMPVRYRLLSIEDLFTDTYMGRSSKVGDLNIQFTKINRKIKDLKIRHCENLRAEGLASDCRETLDTLKLTKTWLKGASITRTVGSYQECVEMCYGKADCLAAQYCVGCARSDADYRTCEMHKTGDTYNGLKKEKWEATIFLQNLKSDIFMSDTDVTGIARALNTSVSVKTLQECWSLCAADKRCVTVTFCGCPEKSRQCMLYTDTLFSLEESKGTTMFIMPKDANTGADKITKTLAQFHPTNGNTIYIGPACVDKSGCPADNSECANQKCQCVLGNYYSVSAAVCVRSCSKLQKTFTEHSNLYLTGGRLEITYDMTGDECIKQCQHNANCRTFTYTELENVALHKPVRFSSTLEWYMGDYAVDGENKKTDINFCFHSGPYDASPWWSVDLLGYHDVHAVTITNRGDCCGDRLGDFSIHVYAATHVWELCHREPSPMSSGATKTFPCSNPIRGKSVRISKRTLYLHFCEVEVLAPKPDLVNIAVHKPARQSSTYSHAIADRAVDGNHANAYAYGSCSHTAVGQNNPWWYVDLGARYHIHAVVITNRGDGASRLTNFQVNVYATNPEDTGSSRPQRCSYYSGVFPSGESQTLTCTSPLHGRFVQIAMDGREILELCEVGVLVPRREASVDVAKDKPAKQSPTLSGMFHASRAVDGNSLPYWEVGTCTHTELESSPWWYVDLESAYKIQAVLVTNRKEASERLSNFVVEVFKNSLSDPSSEGQLCYYYRGIVPSADTVHLDCQKPLPEGRYVKISLKQRDYLTLCHVAVLTALDHMIREECQLSSMRVTPNATSSKTDAHTYTKTCA